RSLPPFLFTDPSRSVSCPLSLHDALPIWGQIGLAYPEVGGEHLGGVGVVVARQESERVRLGHLLAVLEFLLDPLPCVVDRAFVQDRKTTRLNSSHDQISYAVFCLKKKKKK